MKIALWVLAAICLVSLLLFFTLAPRPVARTESLPWQIEVIDRTHVSVIGLVLNQTTIFEMRDRFQNLEGLTLFETDKGQLTLEAYFGKVSIGSLLVRLIARLSATQAELQQLKQQAVNRLRAKSGDIKWLLADEVKELLMQKKITGLSLIPVYSGLDQSFFQQRFGEPDFRQQLDASSVRWFYFDTGVSLLIDDEGKELIEYQLPEDLKVASPE